MSVLRNVLIGLLLWPAVVAAQPAPVVASTLRTTSTATTSIRVGCTSGGACTGGMVAGPVDVASVTSGGFIGIASNVPGVTTYRLYNNAGTLTWNGVALATGASLSGTLNKIPVFTGANSVGDSIMTQNAGATSITVAGLMAATTITGTITTATQNSITTMTGLTSVGTIGTGTWQGTVVGLTYGGTGANLSGTGGTSQFLRQNTLGGVVTVVRPAISDLSDGTNVALLNTANTFTANPQTVANAGGGRMLSLDVTSGTTASYARWSNTGGNFYVGRDNSTGTTFAATSAYAGVVWVESAHALAFGTTNALRWGINAAGDFTFGASSHIADGSGTPAITGCTGCGASPVIAGVDFAFTLTTGAGSGTPSYQVTLSRTYSNLVCVATPGGGTATWIVSGTGAGATGVFAVTASTGVVAGVYVNVLCRGY